MISQPRTYELFHALGIIDDIKRFAEPLPTMRTYKLPGGTVPLRTWDLYKKDDISRWPDRPCVCILHRSGNNILTESRLA